MHPSLAAAAIPAVVLRDRRIVYVNDAALMLLETTREAILGRLYTDFVAPDELARVADRQARRLRGEYAPSVYGTTLVCGPIRRSVQAHAAATGGDIVVQFIDVTGEVDRRMRLSAVAELGALVQRELREEDIRRVVLEALPTLELEGIVYRPDGDRLRIESAELSPGRVARFEATFGRSMVGLPQPWTPSLRQAWSHGAAFMDEWLAEVRLLAPGEISAVDVADASRRSAAAVRIEVGGRPDAIFVAIGTWLRADDLPAFWLFGSQLSAALDAARSIQVLSRRNADLAALNRVAQASGVEPDVEAFLNRASQEIASALGCGAIGYFLLDRDQREWKLLHLRGGGEDDRRRLARVPVEGTLFGAARAEGVTEVSPVSELPEPVRSMLGPFALATLVTVPVRFRSAVVGLMAVAFRETREAAECRPDLLQAMGAHFAATVETHRLLGDLRGRVSELTLLNDIAVATATLDPVLLLENALRRISSTFGADSAAAYLTEGGELVRTASIGEPSAARWGPRAPLGVGPAGLAVTQRKAVRRQGLPAGDGPPDGVATSAARAAAGVPLLVKDRVLGAFVLERRDPRPFGDPELSLLSAIGVQLGVALENARLFADTRRRIADLEAVNSLALRVFGAEPGDTRSLLASTCRDVARALAAGSAAVFQLDAEGATLTCAAAWGTPRPPDGLAIPLARAELARRALQTQEPVWGLHVFDDPFGDDLDPPPLSLLLVPLTSRRAARGLVAIADAPQRRYGDAEVALAHALASEAAMGLENAELYAEERRRVEELSLLNEVGRSVAGSLDLDHVLGEGARAVRQLLSTTHCHVLLVDAARLELRRGASTAEDVPGLRDGRASLDAPLLAAAAVRERRPFAVHEVAGSAFTDVVEAASQGSRAMLAAPVLFRDQPKGVLVVCEHGGPRRFTPAEIERVMAVANQLAVAIDNARLFEDLRESYADLARAQDQLVRQERLAALGELAAVVAHEVRNPLGVIFNSLGSLRRLVRPAGDAKMLFDIVGEEADRLNRIVGDLLGFAKPSPPSLRAERLERVIEDALAAATAESGGRIAVVRDIAEGLPLVPMDAGLMRQAVLNVALNAVQAMPEGGTLSVRARLAEKVAVIELADTGPGIPEEVRHRIFEPFFTTKPTGTGLGLAVVKRILDDHRGRVQVGRGPAGGTVFALHLPLAATGGKRSGFP